MSGSACFSKMTPWRRWPLLVTLVAMATIVPVLPEAITGQKNPATTSGEPKARIVRLDPRFDKLVPRDAVIEKIADGFACVEGPVWNRQGGYLLFSDIPNNSIFKWKEGSGAILFLKPSGYTGKAPFEGREPGSNGLALDSAGRLVLCEHGDWRIPRLEKDGRKTTLADRYDGSVLYIAASTMVYGMALTTKGAGF